MKSTVIFADQNESEKNKDLIPEEEGKISLSKDEYKNVIKEAYKEGLEEAMNKNNNAISEKPSEQTNAEEGKKEAQKVHAKEEEQTKQKLENIIDRHDIEIMRASSVFPFQLFPDTLIIDTTKITIIQKTLFATETIHSCSLKDLSDVNVQTALFLATLYIRYMPQSPSPGMNEPKEVSINCLKRSDAIKAKNILRGVLIASAENIDIATLSPEEVATVLEKFGKNEGVA